MKAYSRAAKTASISAALLTLAGPATFAASHRDAPGQIGDPAANITDVYAFVSAQDRVTLAMNWAPFQDPDEGPIWTFPSPDVLYEIHVKNNATLGAGGLPVFANNAPNITFQVRFSPPVFQNPNTILAEGRGQGLDAGPIMNVGDARQNMIQTYTVTRVDNNSNTTSGTGTTGTTGSGTATGTRTLLATTNGRAMILPPPNVGKATTPLYNDANGMALQGGIDPYTSQAIYDLGGGRRVFSGNREDAFYFDQGGAFDLLSLRNPGIDTFEGINVSTIVIEVPKSDLVSTTTGALPIIGVYATTSRRQVTVRRGATPSFSAGTFQTVSRMGNPLFNEGFTPAKDKDRYNQVRVEPDNDESFRTYAENPELAILANAVLLKSADPANGPIPTKGRTDLSAVFIPDVLKLDTSTGPVRLPSQAGYNRLGVFGGDTIQSPAQGKLISSGWPNGRRFGDDVVDVGLTAVANQNATLTGVATTPVFDNVNGNDVAIPVQFPFQGPPHSGFNHRHHGPAATTTPPTTP